MDGEFIGSWGEEGDGDGQIKGPAGIAFDADQNMYVVDSLNHRVQKFSLDGKYAYSHAPDIFDARTKKRVGVFRDEDGRPFASSKFIEVHFRDGKVVTMGNEFGLGRH